MFKKSTSTIEPCHLSQVTLLQDVAIRTYQETFSDTNSEALLQQYYKESLNIEKLSAQLQNTNSEFYFLYAGAHYIRKVNQKVKLKIQTLN